MRYIPRQTAAISPCPALLTTGATDLDVEIRARVRCFTKES